MTTSWTRQESPPDRQKPPLDPKSTRQQRICGLVTVGGGKGDDIDDGIRTRRRQHRALITGCGRRVCIACKRARLFTTTMAGLPCRQRQSQVQHITIRIEQ